MRKKKKEGKGNWKWGRRRETEGEEEGREGREAGSTGGGPVVCGVEELDRGMNKGKEDAIANEES